MKAWHRMRIGLFGVLLAAALILGAACGGDNNSAESTLISEGSVAPDFNLSAANGDAATLSDYAGEKNVLLYFSMGSG